MVDLDPVLAMLERDQEPNLPDAGFTPRVMNCVPRSASTTGRLISAAGLVLGTVGTALLVPVSRGSFEGIESVQPWLSAATSPVWVAGIFACVAWAYVSGDFRESETNRLLVTSIREE